MKIAREATAGTEERSDCLVHVGPGESLEIVIEGSSKAFFEESMRKEVESVLKELDVNAGRIHIKDRGALPFTLKARVEAAVRRGV